MWLMVYPVQCFLGFEEKVGTFFLKISIFFGFVITVLVVHCLMVCWSVVMSRGGAM